MPPRPDYGAIGGGEAGGHGHGGGGPESRLPAWCADYHVMHCLCLLVALVVGQVVLMYTDKTVYHTTELWIKGAEGLILLWVACWHHRHDITHKKEDHEKIQHLQEAADVLQQTVESLRDDYKKGKQDAHDDLRVVVLPQLPDSSRVQLDLLTGGDQWERGVYQFSVQDFKTIVTRNCPPAERREWVIKGATKERVLGKEFPAGRRNVNNMLFEFTFQRTQSNDAPGDGNQPEARLTLRCDSETREKLLPWIKLRFERDRSEVAPEDQLVQLQFMNGVLAGFEESNSQ